MDTLELKNFVLGELFTNSYLIFDRETKKAIIIDVPYPCAQLRKYIQGEDIEVLFIALTHAHFDHIGGLKEFSWPFYLHQNDLSLLNDADLNGSALFGSRIVIGREPLKYAAKPLHFDSYPIDVIHTPGHTPGSVSLKVGNWLFSGDTLFCDSIGRTDIPLASQESLLQSIHEKICVLPEDTVIYPGHGPSTTVGREKRYNPFL
ncbi:MAG: MBL fold metallo-hydrolase [Candidatus Omnitrophota bacterium]|nr:MAG: MBL fold metallo-hydrolase [Candidatus Omnitrophota bacterium]